MEPEIEYFDSTKQGNEWFEGRKKGWLVISRRNFGKVRVGDFGVFRAGGVEVSGTVVRIGKVEHPAMCGPFITIDFEMPDGKIFTEKSYNLLAIKLREEL